MSSARSYLIDGNFSNAYFLGEFNCVQGSGRSSSLYFQHLIMRDLAFSVPEFLCHVLRVIHERAGEQVLRIYTLRVVALVADGFRLSRLPIAHRVRDPMRKEPLLADSENSIASIVEVRLPKPTVARLIYQRFKSAPDGAVSLRCSFSASNELFATSFAGIHV